MNTVGLPLVFLVTPKPIQDTRVGAESLIGEQDGLFEEILSTTMLPDVVGSRANTLEITDEFSMNEVSDHSVEWRVEAVVQLPQQLNEDVPEIALHDERLEQIGPSELSEELSKEGEAFVPPYGKNLPNAEFSLVHASDLILIEPQSHLPALLLRTGSQDGDQGNPASIFNVVPQKSTSSELNIDTSSSSNIELTGIRLDDVLSIGNPLKQSAGDVLDFSNGISRRDVNHTPNIPLSEIMAFMGPKEVKVDTDAAKVPQDVFASLLSKFSAHDGRNHDVAQIGKALDGVINAGPVQDISRQIGNGTLGHLQTASDNSAPNALNLYQRDWPKQLAEILVQQGRYGHHKATVRLDPPELGPLHVTIRQHGNDTFVHVTARHPDTVQILQVTADRLREIMQTDQSGFVQVDVSGHDQSQAEARSYVSTGRTAEQTTDELTGVEDKHADNSRPVTGLKLTHLIDYFA